MTIEKTNVAELIKAGSELIKPEVWSSPKIEIWWPPEIWNGFLSIKSNKTGLPYTCVLVPFFMMPQLA